MSDRDPFTRDVQHRTEVRRVGYLKQARCSCGWVGPKHDSGSWCQKDAEEHARLMVSA